VEHRFQPRDELLNPAVAIGMIHRHPALRHLRFQIAVAQRVSQIPTHTGQTDVFLDAVSFAVNQAGSRSHMS